MPRPAPATACVLLLLAANGRAGGARAEDLAPWAGGARADDVHRTHVEEIAEGRREYWIVQGGTMDGTNCRGPLGCGVHREGVVEQVWESNRSVRLENVGDADVLDPWLSNGRNDYRTAAEIVAAAVADGMSDGEKAFALWWQQVNHRYHFGGDNDELGNPVKVFNVYGYNTCGNDSICLASLWRQAGLKAAPAHAVGHCISQAFYDGGWHFFDGDQHAVYLLRDNATVAGERDIARDHDLVRRSHTYGLLLPDGVSTEESAAALYVYDGPTVGERGRLIDTTMGMRLRPGEAIVWRWGHLSPPKCQGGAQALYPDTIANGLWEYRPDLAGKPWRQGADSVEGIAAGADGLAAGDGRSGSVVWTVRSPYVFVGGRLLIEGTGATFSVSLDGTSWTDVGADLDPVFLKKGPACYSYRLRCQLTGAARLRRLAIVNDLQMAPLALPAMAVGRTRFVYADASPGKRRVRITHEWVERSASRPPAAPPGALAPADGGETDGTDVVFRWTPPVDPDGDAIADYHCELSARADMRWPLSMTFARLISRTADKGKAQYSLPRAGLLAPDVKYYWRVRAKDAKGVWGPWSRTWSFTARGPAYPVDVTLDFDKARGLGTLRWRANPVGRRPATFRVYASDEKGFAATDEPYAANVGASKEFPSPFPATFVAETRVTSMVVLGQGVALPGANRTYYRVVAVDAKGRRSGPSDFVEAPRPVVYSSPVTAAKVGTPYRSQVAANRSIGDLRSDPREVRGFWDVEKLVYALAAGPRWLSIDPATGILSGTPDAPGSVEVTVSVTIERQVRTIDEGALKWGTLKFSDARTEALGPAVQKFVVRVERWRPAPSCSTAPASAPALPVVVPVS